MLKFPKNINVKIANAAGIYEHFHEIKFFKNDTLVNSRLDLFNIM